MCEARSVLWICYTQQFAIKTVRKNINEWRLSHFLYFYVFQEIVIMYIIQMVLIVMGDIKIPPPNMSALF